MKDQTLAFEDAIDLLDADHKLVKAMFIDYSGMAQDGAPPEARKALAGKICEAITAHATIEEEIFYPAVRSATGDDPLLDEAQEEHDEIKELIAQVQAADAADEGLDELVKELAKTVDHHVMDEREKVFLEARNAALDLRGMVPELAARKKALQARSKSVVPSPRPIAAVSKEAA